MSPVIPHFANECLEYLEENKQENKKNWPKINKSILINENVNFVIQVNGKTRLVMSIKTDIEEKEILKKIYENDKIKTHLNNKKIKKTIFIKNKLINIII